jgi:hypothetical protein
MKSEQVVVAELDEPKPRPVKRKRGRPPMVLPARDLKPLLARIEEAQATDGTLGMVEKIVQDALSDGPTLAAIPFGVLARLYVDLAKLKMSAERRAAPERPASQTTTNNIVVLLEGSERLPPARRAELLEQAKKEWFEQGEALREIEGADVVQVGSNEEE